MVWSLKHRKLLHSFDVRGFLKHPNWPLRDFKVSMIFRIQIVLFNPTSESLKRYMMYMHHWQSCLICFFSEIVILFSGRLPFAVKNLHLGFLLGVKVNNQPMVLFANKFLQSTHTKNHQTKGCGGRWIASTAIKRFRRAQRLSRLSHQGFFPVKKSYFCFFFEILAGSMDWSWKRWSMDWIPKYFPDQVSAPSQCIGMISFIGLDKI